MPVPAYPHAERQPVVDDLHGHRVADPYRWLEDPSAPATRDWSRAQDALWRRHTDALVHRDRWHERVTELSLTGGLGAPLWRGGRRFHVRHDEGAEHEVLLCVDPDGTERVLLDPTGIDPSGRTALDAWQVDLEGRQVAVQLSRNGTERSELSVLDVASGTRVDGPIDRCRYSPVAWLPGGHEFYYVRARPDDGSRRVRLHRVGTPTDRDVVVYGDGGGPTTSYGIGTSVDGRWLAVSAGRRTGNDLWLADLAQTPADRPELRPVQQGVDASTVAVVGRDGRLYVVTNRDAPRGRICVTDPTTPDAGHWRDLVTIGPDEVFADLAILDGPELARPLLLVTRFRHAVSVIGVHDLEDGRWLRDVPLPGPGSVGSLATRPEGGHEVWFTYTDPVTPGAVYRYDARTGETAGFGAAAEAAARSEVRSHEIVFASADGTEVRMVLRARPDAGAGPRPTILYAYGGFGIPLTPSYSNFEASWVDAGGVFAKAHVRGGGEEGDRWHRAGTLARKQNSVDDLLAAAQRLVDDGWTSPELLCACGESNGGLLVGAAITQRPELFAAAVCSAPLTDMARYERTGLGPKWTGEYGSASDPEQLGWLLGYSPYHRVRAGVRYPATLLTVGDGDTRVDPLHARKLCAALQWAGGDRPVLLRRDAGAGHAARGAGRGVALTADLLAFLGERTGLVPSPDVAGVPG